MCELDAGHNDVCDAPGGVDVVDIIPLRDDNGNTNVATFTFADGAVTDFTLVNGKKSHTFNVEAETANFTDDSVGEKVAGSHGYTHTSTVVLHGNTAQDIVNVDNLNKGRHAVIHHLADGTYELLHMTNGAKCQSSRASGTVYEDMNGTTLTMTSKEKEPALKIPEAIVLLLRIPLS